jgi:hypothetical protein
MELTEEQLKRFWAKVDKETENECWEWTAATSSKGYGQFAIGGVSKSTHRISYIMHKGKIPDGLMICHTCNNPPCVNPNHLYAGSNKENMQQASNEKRLAPQQKTHCKAGHEFTPENTALYKQKKRGNALTRVCKTCKKINDKRRVNTPERQKYSAEYWKQHKGIPASERNE